MMHGFAFVSELYFFTVVVIFLGASCFSRPGARGLYVGALLAASVGIVICLAAARQQGLLFAGTYRVDLFSQVFKVLLAMGLFLVICICGDLEGIPSRRHSEFYLLLFTCTLAMMLLVSSVHLLTIYVALELSSYSLYVLVALRRDRKMGIEAGLKYFLIGACASAVMLFGIALLYGSIQFLAIADISRELAGGIERPLVLIGLLLTLGGFFFKLAVFPFHFWAPDVYQGAPNQVAAYIATASKVAAVAILVRIVAVAGGHSADLAHILVVLSILSMTVGNLAAIAQKDFKRLLAYSSVAHAGYVLIGILSLSDSGYAAALYYALAVLLMKFTSFMVLVKSADRGGNLRIDALAGLHRRSPILAMALMLSLFGLAGIPPTIGFTGKLLVFTAAIEQGYFALVLIAMINVVISLYYYLMVVKAAYLLEPEGPLPALVVSPADRLLAAGLVAAIVVFGIYPPHLIEVARAAVQYLH
jgi:NADH-quinone oxidoreductase subunit N